MAIFIVLDDGFPIYYLQDRIGKNAIPFKLLKFRTMKNVPPASDPRLLTYEARLTRMGRILRKTALDELPQLVNILRGEMSFVGPRPVTPDERDIAMDQESDFSFYFTEIPGLTGIAQIYAEKFCSYNKRMAYTRYYTRNKSLYFDLKLIFLSLYVSISGKWDLLGKKA